jgi:sugar lactone lactonase YvrE
MNSVAKSAGWSQVGAAIGPSHSKSVSMITREFGRAAIVACGILALPSAALCTPVKLWETTGLKTPESALPVPAEGIAYVSNIAGKPTDKDGNGFISKVSLKDGKIVVLEWVTGLDAPKGLALANGHLYVSDIDKLVEIDPKGGKIVARYDAPGAKFLNDVSADAQGYVFVSDSSTSTIWRLDDGKLEKWLETPDLKFPNGLHVSGDKVIVAAWGPPGTSASSSAPANLLEVSPDKTIRQIGDKPLGNLDGLEPYDADSFLVTDWVAGALYKVDKTGKADLLLNLNQGSADIGYVPQERMVLIPMMMDNKLVAYRLD